ncbi:MAG TPA: glycosyltransferase, partial [bacterium]|nr:glycosyltransferase [bacterium]
LRERAARDARLRFVLNAANRGFAAANNQGFALARGNVLVVLNNDTVVAQNWLTRLLAVLDEFPDAGIVGPRTNRASGPQVVNASYRTHSEMEGFARGLARSHWGQSVEGRRLVAFCWAMRRSLLEKIGGFDESFGLGNCEDDDFCLRAAQVGFRTRIVLDAFVHHAGSQTFRAENIDYEKALRANFEIFKKKWGMDSAARAEDGYPFLELAAKALQPAVPLPDPATIRTGDALESQASVAAANAALQTAPSNTRLKLQAGLLPGAPPRPALRDLFRKAGHDGPLPVFASTAALNAELNRADLLLIAAGDVELTAATLRELAEILYANPQIGAVGPVSNAAPLPQKVEGNYKDLDRGLERFATKQQQQHGRTWRDVSHLGAFALLLRGEAVRQAGGLRADLPISESLFECYPRLRSAGYHVACAPGVYLHHSKLTEEEG